MLYRILSLALLLSLLCVPVTARASEPEPEAQLTDLFAALDASLQRHHRCSTRTRALNDWLDQHLTTLEAIAAPLRRRARSISPEAQVQLDEALDKHLTGLFEHAMKCADHAPTQAAFRRFTALSTSAPEPAQAAAILPNAPLH